MLEAEGYIVDVPNLPNPDYPVASEWVDALSGAVGTPSEKTYLAGHSLGCITILRYLETLKDEQKIGGVVFVAGFGERFKKYTPGNHDTFFDQELNWQIIRNHCGNFVAIHSRDDPNVEFRQLELLREKLGAKAVVAQGMGHFGTTDGIFEVPIVYNELLAMSDNRDSTCA